MRTWRTLFLLTLLAVFLQSVAACKKTVTCRAGNVPCRKADSRSICAFGDSPALIPGVLPGVHASPLRQLRRYQPHFSSTSRCQSWSHTAADRLGSTASTARANRATSLENFLICLLLFFLWTLAAACKRKNNCPKYCLPCTYRGPIFEKNKTILIGSYE
ncbi:unnamed protein product [Leptidea sinapis]|nr:unnamed protein product [Leptidea sinapis]